MSKQVQSITNIETKFRPQAVMDAGLNQNIQIDAHVSGDLEVNGELLEYLITRTYLIFTWSQVREQDPSGRPLIIVDEEHTIHFPENEGEIHIVEQDRYHPERPSADVDPIEYCRTLHSENTEDQLQESFERVTHGIYWCGECEEPVEWTYHTPTDARERFHPCGHLAYGNRLAENPHEEKITRGQSIDVEQRYEEAEEVVTVAEMDTLGQTIESLSEGDQIIFNDRVQPCTVIEDDVEFANDQLPRPNMVVQHIRGPNHGRLVILITKYTDGENVSYESPRVYALRGKNNDLLEIQDRIARIGVLERNPRNRAGVDTRTSV